MAGEHAQTATARALADLHKGLDLDIGLLGLGAAAVAGDAAAAAAAEACGSEEEGGDGGGRGRGGDEGGGRTAFPLARSPSPLPTPLPPPSAPPCAKRSAKASAKASGDAGAGTTVKAPPAAGPPSRVSPVRAAASGAADPSPVLPLPAKPTATGLSHGAQAEAARKALALNLELQATLRKELTSVDETLKWNREVMNAAEARLSAKRCAGITTSSDKFRWSRAVGKFLQFGAHPGRLGLHKEQELLLRKVLVPWNTVEVKALSRYIAANHPEALHPAIPDGVRQSLIDWEKVAAAVFEAVCRNRKRNRVPSRRTAEDCRRRWAHFEMMGAATEPPWTKEEDLAIMVQAEQRKSREWVKIAEEVEKANGGRTRRSAISCLRRFQYTLNTKFVRLYKWTEEEDRLLTAAVKRYGPRAWLAVAKEVPGKTPVQCRNHYCRDRTAVQVQHLRGDQERSKDGRLHRHVNQQQQQVMRQPERGQWTLPEERRLCLAVRAVMPQKNTASAAVGAAAATGGRGVESGSSTVVPAAAAGAGKDKGKRSRRDSEASLSPSSLQSSLSSSSSSEGGAPPPPPQGGGEARGSNPLQRFAGVNWGDVARLVHTRSSTKCREKWFEVLDPSVSREREWEPEEDEQLLKAVEAKGIGEWRMVEDDMADWAQRQGRLRRTDHGCRRRYNTLQPEKYAQYKRMQRDRREVEPRVNVPRFANHGAKTEITLEDFDVVESSEDGDGDRDDDEEEGDDDGDEDEDEDESWW